MITEPEFQALADQGYNRIPLVAESVAGTDTALSLYSRLVDGRGAGRPTFLLESADGGAHGGRNSYIGLPARTLLRADGFGERTRTRVITDGCVVATHHGDPLEAIAAYRAGLRVAPASGLPRFCGGLVGYFGYDTVRHIERRLEATCPPDTLGLPDILLMDCEELAILDNATGRLRVVVHADPAEPGAHEAAASRLDDLLERLRRPVPTQSVESTGRGPAERPFARPDYLAAVAHARTLIAAGDLMQVQVGQRISMPFTGSPLSLYRELRALNPSPYMGLYDFGAFQVVGASPEILVRVDRPGDKEGPDGSVDGVAGGEGTVSGTDAGTRRVTIRPLAGTRPRGATPGDDRANERDLRRDPKERAEHLMLIDLARNDIGRIAETGSVRVTEAFGVERYSHVMHLVSNVEGTVREGLTAMDVFRATFPAGTLTGAPKVRAMEVIDRLEPVKRGVYGGACGYWSHTGDMDLSIAIRTGVVKDGMLHVQASAGVVADSVPEAEWRETEHKARAVLRAGELVAGGGAVPCGATAPHTPASREAGA